MNYKDYVGMDITSLVTLPVWIMEPYTMLQKVAEIMEYTDLLDKAAMSADEYERYDTLLPVQQTTGMDALEQAYPHATCWSL